MFSSWGGLLRSRRLRLGVALVGPFAVAAGFGLVRESVTGATAALVLVVWVVAVSATGDRIAALVAAVSGGIWFDFFLAPPYEEFAIADDDDVEVAVLLVVIGIIVTEIALWGHRQQARAARRSGYLEGVLKAAHVVAEGETPPAMVTSVVALEIADLLGVSDCRFVDGAVMDAQTAILDHDGTLTRQGHVVDVARQGLPTDEEIAVPVRRGSHFYGYFVFNSATELTYPSAEQLRVAVLLADQTAGVLADRG